MSTTETSNVEDLKVNRPVKGTPKIETPQRSDQEGPAEFLAAIDKILDIEGVMAIRWTQYTPYFNDGDECIFGVHEPEVLLGGRYGAAAQWRDSWTLYTRDKSYGERPAWGSVSRDEYNKWERDSRVYEINGASTREVVEALEEFSARNPVFYDVMYQNFGDHAQVTASREGFEIDEYGHD